MLPLTCRASSAAVPCCLVPVAGIVTQLVHLLAGRKCRNAATSAGLRHADKLYDSKPIIGYAHGVSTGVPLGLRDINIRLQIA